VDFLCLWTPASDQKWTSRAVKYRRVAPAPQFDAAAYLGDWLNCANLRGAAEIAAARRTMRSSIARQATGYRIWSEP